MSVELEHLNVVHNSGNGTTYFTIDSDGLHMFSHEWVNHDFVPINPTGATYRYDIIYSCDAGNQFYIGWERYDANKTNRSNNACIYPISVKPTTDVVRLRARGTVNLATDGVNPTAFIRLRILNAWSGTSSDSSKKSTIHALSLQATYSGESYPKQIYQNGIFSGNVFRENCNGIASIGEYGFIDGTAIYEY